MHSNRRKALAAVAASLAAPITGRAQSQPYPSRTIRFILPFPAGSGTDVGARVVAKQITEMTRNL